MNARTRITAVVILTGLGIAVSGSFGLSSDAERPDCPGQITCPLTGEPVCRDKCPLIDRTRDDCPGMIVCPLTGKLVCKDRCPLGKKAQVGAKASDRPSCCAKQPRNDDS